MKEYKVEFYTTKYDYVNFYKVHSVADLIIIVKEDLDAVGNGCADIFDDEDNFITHVKI